jgi:hypothetical protein
MFLVLVLNLIERLVQFGATANRMILCHVDLWHDQIAWLQQLVAVGIVLGFDMIGLAAVSDVLPFPTLPTYMDDAPQALPPRDHDIACCIAKLGHVRLLLDSTVYFRTQYERYGGGGYTTHVLNSFRAKVSHCLSQKQLLIPLWQWWRHDLPLELLTCYVPLPPMEIPKDYLTCSICKTDFEPIVGEYFSKFDFFYCSTKCLRRHRLAGFNQETASQK